MVDASPGAGPPQPGTPAAPAGGWRQQPPPWRPQPRPSPQRPARRSEEAGEVCGGEKRKGGCKGRLESGCSRHGAASSGVRPARRGRAGGRAGGGEAGAQAALPSEMRRGGSRAPLGRGRRGGSEARLRAAAARSYRSPPHHLPPGCRHPLSPRQRAGRSSRASTTGRGASRRRIPPDTLQPGWLRRGERGRRGAREAGAGGRSPPSGPAKSGRSRWGQGPEKQLESEESGRRSPGSRRPAAARRANSSPPHTRRRGAARGAAEALTPPAPSAVAAARTRGARRRRRSSPWRLLPAAGFPRGAK